MVLSQEFYFVDCMANDQKLSAFVALTFGDPNMGQLGENQSMSILGVEYEDNKGSVQAGRVSFSSNPTFQLLGLGISRFVATYPDFPLSWNGEWYVEAAELLNEETGRQELSGVRIGSSGYVVSSAVPEASVQYQQPPELLLPAPLVTRPSRPDLPEQFWMSGFNGQIFREGGVSLLVGERQFVLNYGASDTSTLQVDEYTQDAIISHRMKRQPAYSYEGLDAIPFNPLNEYVPFLRTKKNENFFD